MTRHNLEIPTFKYKVTQHYHYFHYYCHSSCATAAQKPNLQLQKCSPFPSKKKKNKRQKITCLLFSYVSARPSALRQNCTTLCLKASGACQFCFPSCEKEKTQRPNCLPVGLTNSLSALLSLVLSCHAMWSPASRVASCCFTEPRPHNHNIEGKEKKSGGEEKRNSCQVISLISHSLVFPSLPCARLPSCVGFKTAIINIIPPWVIKHSVSV